MPDLQSRIERTRVAMGAALMELRIIEEQRKRILTRAERAYADFLDFIWASDDPKVIPDQA